MSDEKLIALLDNLHHATQEHWRGRVPSSKIDDAREAIFAFVAQLTKERDVLRKYKQDALRWRWLREHRWHGETDEGIIDAAIAARGAP